MTLPPIVSGQPTQRLLRSQAVTSDSQGRATFSIGPAELGLVYEGSVQVPNAPAGALFAATILGTNWGQWAGPTNFGPVQMWGGEVLAVTATGLTPSTQYTLTLTGVSKSQDLAVPIPPAAPMSVVSVETATLLVNGRATAGSGDPVTIRPPSLTRRLTIIAVGTGGGAGTGVYTVTGVTSGAVYGTYVIGNLSATARPQFVAIEPSVDATYTLTSLSGAAQSHNLWVLASFTNPLIGTNPVSPLPVLPAFGEFISNFDIAVSANTTNQGLVAAPGAGRSIVLQGVTLYAQAANGPVAFSLHAAGSTNAIARGIVTATGTEPISWPAGFELPVNTALQVDTALATSASLIVVSGTYIAGLTV